MIELKEFRFACVNLEETISFYTNCLLMVLHKKVELASRVYLLFRYQRNDVSLRFEHSQPQKKTGMERSAPKNSNEGPIIFKRPVTSTDLLIYVLSLDKIIQRVRNHGFVIFVEPMKINDETRACVLLDPNGMRVRLVESVHCLVEVAFEARVGYVSVPVKEFVTLSKTIAFYQQVFGPLAVEIGRPQAQRHSRQISIGKDDELSKSPLKSTVPVDTGSMFTVRDTESFTEDMMTMVWLGNASRSTHACLCLRHIMDRQISTDSVSKPPDNGGERFLGIVFVVTDLERCQTHIGSQDAFPVQVSATSTTMGMPPWFSFFDPAFINVQIREDTNVTHRPKTRLSKQPALRASIEE